MAIRLQLWEVDRALTHKLGAERDDSGHHVFYYLTLDEGDHTVGKVSHSWSGNIGTAVVLGVRGVQADRVRRIMRRRIKAVVGVVWRVGAR